MMVKNLQPLEIATAMRQDLFEIAAFLDDCWRTAYREIVSSDYLDSMSADARYERLLTRFEETPADFLIIRDASILVGVAVFGKSNTDGYPDDGEISAIYLRHDYTGKGHGHVLFAKAEAVLAERGHAYFVLDVLSENTRAIDFYHKHGYQSVSERSIRLGEKDYPLTVFRKKNCLVADNELGKDRTLVDMT